MGNGSRLRPAHQHANADRVAIKAQRLQKQVKKLIQFKAIAAPAVYDDLFKQILRLQRGFRVGFAHLQHFKGNLLQMGSGQFHQRLGRQRIGPFGADAV